MVRIAVSSIADRGRHGCAQHMPINRALDRGALPGMNAGTDS
jgi:hypothetical protein